MNAITTRLLTGWHFTRWVQLAAAIFFLWTGVQRGEGIAYFAAAFFGLQAMLNVGCCGAGGCAPRTTGRNADAPR